MAKQTINVGTTELAGDGESLRTAFQKVNSNFDELYSTGGTQGYTGSRGSTGTVGFTGSIGSTGTVGFTGSQGSTGTVGFTGSAGITPNFSAVAEHILPATNLTYDLGSTSSQWRSLYVGTSTIYLGGTALSVSGGNLTVGGSPVTGGGNAFNQSLNTEDSVTFNSVGATTVNVSQINGTNPGNELIIQANNHNWNFGADGSLTFPDTSTQHTAWLGGGSSSLSTTANSSNNFNIGNFINNATLDINYTAFTGDYGIDFNISYQEPLDGTKGVTVGAVETPLILSTGTVILKTDLNSSTSTWTFGTTGTLTVPGSIIPTVDVVYDLGSPSNRFKDLYLSGNTINLGDATISATGSALELPVGTTTGGVSIGTIIILGSVADTTELTAISTATLAVGDSYVVASPAPAHLWTWNSTAFIDLGVFQGPQGELGYTGSRGYSGSQGVTGYVGSQGANGYTGSLGYTGSSGFGFTGSTGATGFTGSLGFTGSSGLGFTGSTGATGFTGSKGDTGSAGAGFTGSSGEPGVTGFTGSLGFTGSSGAGFTGSKGDTGSTGFTGSLGFTGSTGATGAGFTGSTGATGYTGSKGDTGSSGLGFTGSTGFTGSLGFTGSSGLGFTGSTGATGFTGSAGTGGTGGIGVWDEDLFVGTFTNLNFVGLAVVASTQSTQTGGYAVITLSAGTGTGAVGYTGSQGNIGYSGSKGDTGSSGFGFTGSTGATGFTGSKGDTGSSGFGFTGSTGATGFTGSAGETGSSGFGFTGSTGATGYTGSFGYTGSTGSPGTISWSISASGTSDYVFSGPGIVAGNTNDPVLYLYKGFTYTFVNTTGSSHPFAIRVSNGGADYTLGVSGSQSGTQTFTVPMNAPATLYYQCTIHSVMGNVINIV